MKSLFLLLYFPFVLGPLIFRGSNAQEVTRTFKGIKQINVGASSSDISLSKRKSADMEVTVTFTYTKPELEPLFQQDGAVLTLSQENHNISSSGHSKWIITVPDGLEIKTKSTYGNVEVADLKGNITSDVEAGTCIWRNITGESSIRIGSGRVQLDSFDGKLNVRVSHGGVTIRDFIGDLVVGTDLGHIAIEDLKGSITAEAGSGHIKAEKVTLTSSSSLNTGTGHVSLTFSGPSTNSINLNSGFGDVVLDCNGNPLQGHIIISASKKNGEIVAPFNFDSTEEINPNGGKDTMIQKTVRLGAATPEIKITTGFGKAQIKK